MGHAQVGVSNFRSLPLYTFDQQHRVSWRTLPRKAMMWSRTLKSFVKLHLQYVELDFLGPLPQPRNYGRFGAPTCGGLLGPRRRPAIPWTRRRIIMLFTMPFRNRVFAGAKRPSPDNRVPLSLSLSPEPRMQRWGTSPNRSSR